MKRSGIADLPLHGGPVPDWLAHRMTLLGAGITEAIVRDYGVSAFLSRLSDPFWFHAFGSVLGMDWHPSGITTSAVGTVATSSLHEWYMRRSARKSTCILRLSLRGSTGNRIQRSNDPGRGGLGLDGAIDSR